MWFDEIAVAFALTAGTTTETEEATSFNKIDDMPTWGCGAWKAQPGDFLFYR